MEKKSSVFVHIRLCCIRVYKKSPIKCLCCADLYRHSPTYMTGTFWRVQCNSNFAQFRIEYTYCQLCVYKGTQQKSKLKHTGTWTAAAWPPCRLCYCSAVLFHHPILQHLHFHKEKCDTPFNMLSFFLTFLKLCKPNVVCPEPMQVGQHSWYSGCQKKMILQHNMPQRATCNSKDVVKIVKSLLM